MDGVRIQYTKSLRFRLLLFFTSPLVVLGVSFIFISLYTNQALLAKVNEIYGMVVIDTAWIRLLWIGAFVAAVVIISPINMFAIRSIINPLRRLTAEAQQLASGDISIMVEQNREDEFGMLQASFAGIVETWVNQAKVLGLLAEGDLSAEYKKISAEDVVGESLSRMINANNALIKSISMMVEQVSQASAQVASGSQTMAHGSSEQSAAVDNITQGMLRIKSHSDENAQLADKAAGLSSETEKLMRTSLNNMNELVSAMSRIAEASASISQVIKVIEDIAFQTNILALNAAVEAARAGQHGKGFAVVADEVRTLASKSASAANETTSIISETIERVESGTKMVEHTKDSLVGLNENFKNMSDIVAQIENASAEQSVVVEDVNKSLDQVSGIVQSNTSTAEESAATSEELAGQAAMLQNLVSRFKLSRQEE